MKTITNKSEIIAALPAFSPLLMERVESGEWCESGTLAGIAARVFYSLPDDAPTDDDGEFRGNWTDHLVRMEIDSASAASTLGRIGGAKKSHAKAAAARANGAKGGRPRKTDPQ